MTSHDAVDYLRKITRIKKIGHGGTLDPQATGVLPVALGKATRLLEYLPDKTKVYQGELLLGKVTTTQDIWGEVLAEKKKVNLKKTDLQEILQEFTGQQSQIPPPVSAIHWKGKRLYQWAREGQLIRAKARKIYIFSIEIIDFKPGDNPRAILQVNCSQGTYLRTLFHDIGNRLGCGGCLASLQRLRSGYFWIKDAVSYADIKQTIKKGMLEKIIIPIEKVLYHMTKVYIKKEKKKILLNGNYLPLHCFSTLIGSEIKEYLLIYDEDSFLAVGKLQGKGKSRTDLVQPIKTFG